MINFGVDIHVTQKGEKMTEEKKMTFPLYNTLSDNSHHFSLRPFG